MITIATPEHIVEIKFPKSPNQLAFVRTRPAYQRYMKAYNEVIVAIQLF